MEHLTEVRRMRTREGLVGGVRDVTKGRVFEKFVLLVHSVFKN